MATERVFLNTGRVKDASDIIAIDIESNYNQVYDNIIKHLPHIRTKRFEITLFLFWTVSQAGRDEHVMLRMDGVYLKRFNLYLENNGRGPISRRTFYRYIDDLCQADLIIKMKEVGMDRHYYLNAAVFWRGSHQVRREFVRSQHAWLNNVPMVVDEIDITPGGVKRIGNKRGGVDK